MRTCPSDPEGQASPVWPHPSPPRLWVVWGPLPPDPELGFPAQLRPPQCLGCDEPSSFWCLERKAFTPALGVCFNGPMGTDSQWPLQMSGLCPNS